MVSVIIVDYKTIEKTCDYIEHLADNVEYKELYHYIIIDNDVHSSALEYLKSRYGSCYRVETLENREIMVFNTQVGEVSYCVYGENAGFAKGNNLGVSTSSYLYHDEYYIISNNDLRLKKKLNIYKIINVFKSDNCISVIGPRIEGVDSKLQSPYKKATPFYLLIVYQWSRFWPFYSKGDLIEMNHSGYCYRIMGCFMIIKAEPFKEIGGFDEETFMYCEEMILSERMKSKGYKCYYYNDYTVVHEHGSTVKQYVNNTKNDRWTYSSLLYYCKEYRNAGSVLLFFATLSRALNVRVMYLKEGVKKYLRKKKG